MTNMRTFAALFLLLCSAEGAAPSGAPAFAPIVASTKLIAASAPAVARSFGASIAGPSDTCRIPASGGKLINAPLDKGNPMTSNIQPYAQPASHTAHVDSAGEFWDSITIPSGEVSITLPSGEVIPLNAPQVAELLADIQDASGAITSDQGSTDAASPEDAMSAAQAVRQVGSDLQAQQYTRPEDISGAVAGSPNPGLAGGLAADLTRASAALQQTAQANSAPQDLQDADVATTDASLKTLQGKGINNPATLAVQAGKPVSAVAQAPLTAFPNILVLAPSALPSALQARAAAPVQPGGRKMLVTYPDCCNSYTVKAGDTLASIAAAYGQPDNGVKYLQAINDIPGGTVAPGQSIMLPCGRVLSYITAFDAGLLTKAASG